MGWKLAQAALFVGLVVFFHEVVMRDAPLFPGTLMAFVITGLVFSLTLSFQMWRERRRARRLGLPEPQLIEPEPAAGSLALFVRECWRKPPHQNLK